MAVPSIGECLSYGVDNLKKNPVYAIVGMLLVGIISYVPLMFGPMIFPPKSGQCDKVVLPETSEVVIIALCQPEGGTRVVPGP
ncbi:MAG: hypothetical protein PF961_06905, partial [Planctomycetota bacterium]|nr:hypothetical protein [Planctomycetota bacterium]